MFCMRDILIQPELTVRSIALPLAVVFIVAMSYGVVLPVLPFILAQIFGEAARIEIAWHTGLLMGIYMFTLFLFAPMWGKLSDRVGRQNLIQIGLAGLSAAMLLLALLNSLPMIYTARVLAGLFSAAVLPAVFAQVGDTYPRVMRAKAFAWLSSASALGFMFGPALSGWIASTEIVAEDDAFIFPFYVVAALIALVLVVVSRFSMKPSMRHTLEDVHKDGAFSLGWLLALSLLVMFGLGSFEVSLALQGQQVLNLGPREVGWLFAECSLVMILVQSLALAPLIQRFGGSGLLAPAFLAMAIGIGLLPYATNYPMLLLVVAVVAAASGLLIPALAYMVSLAAGTMQGSALGKQTAASSLGQAAGSAVAGWLFGLLVDAPYLLTAGLLILGMFMVMYMPRIKSRSVN